MNLEVSRRMSLTGKFSEGMPTTLGPSPQSAANLHAERRGLFCQSDTAPPKSKVRRQAALPALCWA